MTSTKVRCHDYALMIVFFQKRTITATRGGPQRAKYEQYSNISHKNTKNDFNVHGLLKFSIRHVVHGCDFRDFLSTNVIWRKRSFLLGLLFKSVGVPKQEFNSFTLESI